MVHDDFAFNSFKNVSFSVTSTHWDGYPARQWQLCLAEPRTTPLALALDGVLPISPHFSFQGLSHGHLLAGPPGCHPALVLHPPVSIHPSSWDPLDGALQSLHSFRHRGFPAQGAYSGAYAARISCQPGHAIGGLLHQFPISPFSANHCPTVPALLSGHLSDHRPGRAPARHLTLLSNPDHTLPPTSSHCPLAAIWERILYQPKTNFNSIASWKATCWIQCY